MLKKMMIGALVAFCATNADAADGPKITWSYSSTESGSGQGAYAGAVNNRGPVGSLVNFFVKKKVLPPACEYSQTSSFSRTDEIEPRVRARSSYSVRESATSCPAQLRPSQIQPPSRE